MLECALFLSQRDHKVQIFANDLDNSAFKEIQTGRAISHRYVPVKSLPAFRYGSRFYQECSRMIAQDTYDVLGTYGCVSPTGGIYWAQSVHKAWLERSKQFRPAFSLARWKQRLNPLHPLILDLEAEHFTKGNYRKIIAATDAIREELQTFYGVPPEDIIVIPNGFSPAEFNPERRLERRSEMRNKLGLGEDQIVLLFVANELDRKGYATILDAMRKLGRPDLRLVVVGKPDVKLVQQKAAEYGVLDQVIAAGMTRDVSSFHAASDLFVLPTQYEAFCLAILEALGSGLPVITTRVPGAHDAIQENINGLLIDDPKNGQQLAMALEILCDQQTRERITANAATSVRAYQWPTVLLRYENLLQEHCA
jgi:UDP-glucose:(heptosyl)LPS alpha-1,3-glucosyltransferase